MIDIPLQSVKDKLQSKAIDGVIYLYDIVRKDYVVLQPEELVRQMLCLYLIEEKGYPLSRFQLERGVLTNDKRGRYDIIIYDKAVKPWMLIECKSHKVNLSQAVVDQLGGYNRTINAPYLMVSNGLQTICYRSETTDVVYEQLVELPAYPS